MGKHSSHPTNTFSSPSLKLHPKTSLANMPRLVNATSKFVSIARANGSSKAKETGSSLSQFLAAACIKLANRFLKDYRQITQFNFVQWQEIQSKINIGFFEVMKTDAVKQDDFKLLGRSIQGARIALDDVLQNRNIGRFNNDETVAAIDKFLRVFDPLVMSNPDAKYACGRMHYLLESLKA